MSLSSTQIQSERMLGHQNLSPFKSQNPKHHTQTKLTQPNPNISMLNLFQIGLWYELKMWGWSDCVWV